jgi:signal transduction histidine kinase
MMKFPDVSVTGRMRQISRWSSLKIGIIGVLLLVTLTFIGFDALRIWGDHARAVQKAYQETTNLVKLLTQNAEDTIVAADASIVGLVQRMEIDGTGPETLQKLQKIMAVRRIAHPALADLIICDEFGNPLANASTALPTNRSVADTEYFRYHRASASREPHLGPPIRSEVPGSWVIPVSRRFDHRDGTFAGVVVAALDSAHFQNLYDTFEIGRNGTVLLTLSDGTVLVRRPHTEVSVGRSLLSTPLFHDYLPKGAIGNGEDNSSVDGVVQLMSYHRSGRFPVVASASLAKDEVLADWRSEVWVNLVGVIALVGMLGFLGLRLAAQVEQNRCAEKTLIAEAEQLLTSQALLQKSWRHLARAQELAESGSFERDMRTGQTTWSDNLYRIYGVDRKGFPVDNFRELIHPADRAHVDDAYRDHVNGIVKTATEFRIIRPDGGCRTTVVDCVLSPGEDGAPDVLLGTVRDVTSARAADERLRSLETQEQTLRRRFSLALDSAAQAIVLYDADDRVVACNTAFLDLHRNAAGERPEMAAILGARYRDMLLLFFGTAPHSLAEHEIETIIAAQIAQLHIDLYERTFRLGDGRWMHLINRIVPDGGTISVLTNVSALKAAEAQQRELEAQLHHSQRLEALGTLAGGIAHDLNNALVPTLMMTEIVMEAQAEDSPERAHLALALAGATRAKELVRRILAFARKEVAEKQEFDLAMLATEAMTMLRASMPATVELITRVEPIPAIFGDSGQLYQVIINLVTNAAQAIGDEPGKITVTLRSAQGGSRVELTVADTGSGMDETTKQRIFDPFFTTKEVNKGTGLGLSIVHGIVISHRGTIAVTSRPGSGSEFSVVLPTVGDRQDDDATRIEAA